LKRLKHTFD